MAGAGNDRSDGELIAEYVKRGNADCFDALYERYRRPLYSYLNNMLPGKPSTVDDLYQKTWLKVINRLDRYEHRQSFLAWLYRIARNTAIDHFRRAQREQHENIEEVQIATEQGVPWQRISHQELAAAVKEAVETLPHEQREVFLLRQKNVPFKDIAEIQECSLNTALGRMHYAVGKLRKILADWKGPR